MPLADRLIFTPHNVDLARSPLAGRVGAETYVLGAFNPGLTRLPNGNLLLMVRVAEALRQPVWDGHVHSIRWAAGEFVLDAWPLDAVDMSDPRVFALRDRVSKTIALTSLSWLLPVELTSDGDAIVAIDYDRAIVPSASYQCYGIEDPRISRVGGRWLMTVCSISPERQATSLYSSRDARDWSLEGLVLDHQNKDMLIFEGLIGEQFWAQTRPLGDVYFAYPPGSAWVSGPAINLATSPDALHWKPCDRPGIRPCAGSQATARIGGGAPPVLTERGWLSLWHGVEPNGGVGVYRTYWSLLDRDDPSVIIATGDAPLVEAAPALTAPLAELMYLHDIVFTTGIVDAGDHYIVASGEADLACRITQIDKRRFA
ncbi:MAG: glycosidase [Sphingomonas sp.]|uniref:glycoside hydrolase family 130 protein n=1 Tax=Sphingomonas sp. TaxID=28214 RepID=UPI0025D163C8|nr:glycosidase [Sphingomonas sp.]MBY0285131.1 glycosidase [Sphingomonas sp.]